MIRIEKKLSQSALEALIVDESIYAIKVPNFISEELCLKLKEYILNAKKEDYKHEVVKDGVLHEIFYGVSRVGMPFNKTYTNQTGEMRLKYLTSAQEYSEKLRLASFPEKSPMETLLEQLNDAWPDKAEIGQLDGRDMSGCICRVTLPKYDLLEVRPHCDTLPPDVSFSGEEFEQQLSINIFMAAPEEGGEFLTWAVPPLEPEHIHSENKSVLLDEDAKSLITIRLKMGDLVLINTRRPHAVKSFEVGERVSIASFFGYTPGKPLQFWS